MAGHTRNLAGVLDRILLSRSLDIIGKCACDNGILIHAVCPGSMMVDAKEASPQLACWLGVDTAWDEVVVRRKPCREDINTNQDGSVRSRNEGQRDG